MPITLPIQIAVLCFQDPALPAPPPEYNIHLVEQPPGGGYKLFVSESFPWLMPAEDRHSDEIPLTPQVSQHLAQLVSGLPDESLSANRMSFDGIDYSLLVLRPDGNLAFHWANEDWRIAPNSQQESWQRVSALADTVYELVRDHRSNT